MDTMHLPYLFVVWLPVALALMFLIIMQMESFSARMIMVYLTLFFFGAMGRIFVVDVPEYEGDVFQIVVEVQSQMSFAAAGVLLAVFVLRQFVVHLFVPLFLHWRRRA